MTTSPAKIGRRRSHPVRIRRAAMAWFVVVAVVLGGLPLFPQVVGGARPAAALALGTPFSCSYPADQPWAADPTTRVSLNSTGGSTTDAYAFDGAVSADGRFVSYTSNSAQHVAGDTNGVADVFVHDRQTKATSRVSVSSAAVQGNRASHSSAISGDGRYVTFTSDASSLLGGDADFSTMFHATAVAPFGLHLPSGFSDFSGGLTIEAWAKPQYLGNNGRIIDLGNGAASDNIILARDGKSNDLVFAIFRGTTMVSLARATGVLQMDVWQHFAVTVTPAGAVTIYKNGTAVGSTVSQLPLNVTRRSNLVGFSNWPGDEGFAGDLDEVAIYRTPLTQARLAAHHQARYSGYTTAVRADSPLGYWRLGEPVNATTATDSSGNGLHGTYHNNVRTGDDGALSYDTSETADAFVHDRQTGQTSRVSVTTAGAEVGDYAGENSSNPQTIRLVTGARGPSISGDGRYISFNFTNALVADDTNGSPDIYIRDRDTDGNGVLDEPGKVSTTRASVGSGGSQGGNNQNGEMSPDARHVTFTSFFPYDPADAEDNIAQIYLRDRVGGTTKLMSRGASGAAGDATSHRATVSADGRHVAYESSASNLVAGDTNAAADVFVRDGLVGSTTRASVGSDGAQTDKGNNLYATISTDGRWVTFSSGSTNLVSDDTNNTADVFVRDLRPLPGTQATTRVSLTKNNAQSAGSALTYATGAMSADGRYVVLNSNGADMVDNDTNNLYDLFVRDRGATSGFNLSPTLGLEPVAQSDEVGLEQFYPYAATDVGAGTAYTNLRTGNLVASFEDATVPANELDAVVRHTYNARRSGVDTGAGAGWTTSVSDLDAGLEVLTGNLGELSGAVTGMDLSAPIISTSVGKVIDGLFGATGQLLELTDEDGTTHRFVRDGGPCSRWRSPPGVSLKVREVFGALPVSGLPEAYELIRPDGVVYRAERLFFAGLVPTLEWRITSVTDRRGNKLTYAYDGLGAVVNRARLRSITHNRHPESPLVRLDYTALGDLDRVVTLPGVTAPDPATGTNRSWERHIDYDIDPATKQLRSVTENSNPLPAGAIAASRTTRFTYGAGNDLASVTDGANHTTRFTYTDGKLTKLTDRFGKDWTYAYTTDASDQTTTTATSPVGATSTYRISPRGPVSPTDPRVGGGNIVSITDAGHGDPPQPITTTYAWTANRLTSSKDGAGAEKTTEYNDLGLVTRRSEPAPNTIAHPDAPDAVTAPVVSTLRYSYPPELNDGSVNCTPPPSSGPVSTEGWCHGAAELVRATMADNHPAQRRITDFAYDPVGNLKRASERATPDPAVTPDSPPAAADRSTAFAYYQYGGLKTIDGPRSDVVDVTTWGDTADAAYGGYDRTGQPSRITDALGKAKVFAYSPYGPTGKVTDRDGDTATSRYDERDNLIEATDPSRSTSAFRYDANDKRTHATSPRGVATATVDDYTAISTYDPVERLTQVSAPGPTPTSPRTVVTTTYADDGKVASQTSPRGSTAAHTTTYAYWPNRSVKTTDAPGDGATRAVTDTYYDTAGRTARVVGPVATATGARPETKITYNPDASVARTETTSAAATPAVTRSAYNAHRELVRADGPRTVDGVEAATASTYDPFGQLTRSRRRLNSSRWVETTTAYDLAGNRRTVSQPTGTGGQLATTYGYDALDRVASQDNDPVNPGHTVTWGYTPEGLQTTRTDSAGGTTLRQVTTAYNPDDTVQSTVATDHAANTSLVTCNFAAGAAPTSGYDADKHLLEARTATTSGPAPSSAAVGCDTGTLQRRQVFAYNEPGWMSSATQSVRSPETNALVTRTQDIAYEPDGNKASVTHAEPGGASFKTTYSYTTAGWTSTVTDWRGKATTTSYLASGAPKSQTVGAGVASGAFDWHPDGSPKALTWRKGAAGAVVRSHTNLAYDPGGQRLSEDASVLQPGALAATTGQARFAYDLMDRLTSFTSPFPDPDAAERLRATYSLDDAGNITTEVKNKDLTGGQVFKATSTFQNGRLAERRTETAGLGGLTTTTATDTFTYDGLGQQTQSTNRATSYDPAGHTKFVDDRTPANADVAYVYDNSGRLISRHEPNAPTDRAKTTLYFYWGPGAALAEEADATGRTLVRYLPDTDGDAIAQHRYKITGGRADPADTAGTWKWLLADTDGNAATHLLDSGDVAEQAAFDPYGRPEKAGSSQTDPTKKGSNLGFQGAHTDNVTGSVVLGRRQYDPTTARFLTPDTFVAAELDLALGTDSLTANRYLFAAANPTAYYEDGHWPWSKNRLYKQYRDVIHREARRFNIEPALLAALIQHEGSGRNREAKFPVLGRLFRRAEQSRLGGSTVGIAQMRPDLASRLALEHLNERLSVNEARKKLVYDTDWAIRLAAASLGEWRHKHGLASREAFIAYAFGPEDLPELRRTGFTGNEGKARGETYDRLAKEISNEKGYKA